MAGFLLHRIPMLTFSREQEIPSRAHSMVCSSLHERSHNVLRERKPHKLQHVTPSLSRKPPPSVVKVISLEIQMAKFLPTGTTVPFT
jgi:hypothetical protein